MSEPHLAQKQALRNSEAKVFSQFNEDGILKMLFDRLPLGSRRFAEFGIGNGKECNTANLSIFGGWAGLLMDGNATDVEKAKRFYNSRPEISPGQVTVNPVFINTENIDAVLAAAAPVDLLSIDIDGMDLWIWRAIKTIQPRVIVIEYNATFGPLKSVSVVYDPQFDRHRYHPSGLYHGASLAALAKVGREKGYILVGCESHGANAFFVQTQSAAAAGFIEMTPDQAYYEHAWRAARFPSVDAQFQEIQHMQFVEI
jgi:hypothetical protein